MGKPYSLDLRRRICDYVAAGNTCRAAARVFGVSAATAVRYATEQRERGDVTPKPQGRPPGRFGKLAPHVAFLIEVVRAEPDITLRELAIAFRVNVETAVKTNLSRLRGRAPVGERLFGTAPFGKWGTQTFIAGLTRDALIAPWVIKGAMDGPAFETYVETRLAPVLEPGTVVILDNLSTHKSPRAAQVLKDHGCWFLFLPPYSPDLNPIEMAFSKLKAHLRRIGARTFDALFTALGDICDLFEPDECWNFLKAAGYASD